MSFDGPGTVTRPSWRVMNLSGFLTQTARRLPDRPGLIWGERRWTWAQIEARVAALAQGFRSLGIGKGDRILVHAKNGNAMLEVMFAAFRIGAVFVPTNFRLLPDEVIYLAQMSQAKLFVCGAEFPAHVAAVRAEAPALRHVVSIGAADFAGTTTDALIEAHAGQPSPVEPVCYDDPCWFFFTSGTTGRSKAAVLTHGQMAFIVTNHLCDLMPGTTEADASLVVAPLSHGAGVHALNQIARGAVSVLMPGDRFDIPEAWRLIAEHRITNMFTVPTILKMLVEHPSAATADASSLRYVIYAGAPMYRADQQTILNRLGRVIVQYFGLGEVTGCITVLPPAHHDDTDGWAREGTCGFPRTGMEVSIQDDAGRILEPFETGEICAIGPGVFAGYHDNPEANAKSFRNGWFRTGDLGHMDREGFVYITGRASDMYISGGSNIYPREVEEKILMHPDIVEVAVLGVPDPQWGEVGVAVCVAREGSGLTEEDLLGWLGPKVARYKLPRRVFFWEALPKSGYGKVPKRMVRDEMQARGLLPLGGQG
jgi:fatty-acyl-CoA synthase